VVDVPGNISTNSVIGIGQSTSGVLEVLGDHDWYRIQLTAGQSITVSLNGAGGNPVSDPYLNLRDASGNILRSNDDGGPELNSRLVFTATTTGTYYIDAGSWEDRTTGTYELAVSRYVEPPLWSLDQIAGQLVSGYWGGSSQHFGVAAGGNLTVNVSALTAGGQVLARAALAMWTDVTGIRFVEITGGGQIVFDDTEDGAFSESDVVGNTIRSSTVNVSEQWLSDYGTGLNSYSFQTYIHEIGHALGLGHAGDYNVDATYPDDVLYRNDAWSNSVMSYFSQTENSYFSDLGFTYNYAVTPMAADVLAMSMLYGLSTTTRTGDTTYGFNSNAGRAVFSASLYPNIAYTIVDSGGVDTLDYSGFANNQVINLNPDTFSNVGGSVGNVSIARGTIIENAIGGSGNDQLIGNAAGNILLGGGGNDSLFGGDGNDVLDGGAGSDSMYGGLGDDRIIFDPADNLANVQGGGGYDVLVFRNLAPQPGFNLNAAGFEAAEVIRSNANGIITGIYNGNWRLVQDTTVASDGSRVIIDADPDNLSNVAQVWSTFDALGRLSSVDTIYDSGSRVFINVDEDNTKIWTQNWFTYDALGRLDSEDRVFDAGGHTFINFDQAGQFNWAQVWYDYDSAGRLASIDNLFDDGSRTYINIDANNSKVFAQDWFTYDQLGRLDSEDLILDNGTRTFINIDQDNSQNWRSAWFTYDAQGRLDTQDVVNDDGSHVFTNYDQAGTESFQLVSQTFNPAGVLIETAVKWDNGSTSYFAG